MEDEQGCHSEQDVSWQLREREIYGYPTDPRVLMVGLLAQLEKGLVGPDDVAEMHLWSSWRLLASASSQGDTTNHEPCNLQVIQLAVSIMDTLTRTHTNKEHRDTNEQTPKTPRTTEKMQWKCVKLYDEERREDRLQSGSKTVLSALETAKNACLARVIPGCDLFVSPSSCNHSRRRRLFGAVGCRFFTCRRTTEQEWRRKNKDFDTPASLASAPCS